MTPDARRPRSGSSDQGQQSQDAGADVKATSGYGSGADHTTVPRPVTRCPALDVWCAAYDDHDRDEHQAHWCCRGVWEPAVTP